MNLNIGVLARQCIEKARGHVAAMIGAKDSGAFVDLINGRVFYCFLCVVCACVETCVLQYSSSIKPGELDCFLPPPASLFTPPPQSHHR